MKWRKLAADLIESDLKYKILMCTAHGKPIGRYLAFCPRVNDMPKLLGGFCTSKEAREACEEHVKAVA